MKKKSDMFSDSVCAVMQTQKVFYHSETENLKQFPECSWGTVVIFKKIFI